MIYCHVGADRLMDGAEVHEKMTPDSSKSTQQKIKESVTDTADRFAR